MPKAPLLQVTDLARHFPYGSPLTPWLDRGVVRAVDGVSLKLWRGETFSIVGESGCGKTTVARLLLDLDRATRGSIDYQGSDIATLPRDAWREYRVSVQAVFQDPTSSLDPKRRIGDIVAEPLIVNSKLRGAELRKRVEGLLEEVGLNLSVVGAFPHELSGGMRQRVAIAQALALRPKIIVLDEPVSALDVSIRAQIMNLLKDLQEAYGVAYVMIAHDLGTVRYLSHHVAAMYAGQFLETAPSEEIFTRPIHPYTIALISAVGSSASAERERIILSGETASVVKPPSGCRFHPRCWLSRQLGSPSRCSTEQPGLDEVGPGHHVACHFAEALIDPVQRSAHIAAAQAPAS